MIATFLPVRTAGGWGLIQPFFQPWSEISFSMYSIVTGSELIERVQEASQGAGQIRPVNSGKLLVECRTARARSHWPLYTRSFQSGIRLPRGQPRWQKGRPQSM